MKPEEAEKLLISSPSPLPSASAANKATVKAAAAAQKKQLEEEKMAKVFPAPKQVATESPKPRKEGLKKLRLEDFTPEQKKIYQKLSAEMKKVGLPTEDENFVLRCIKAKGYDTGPGW